MSEITNYKIDIVKRTEEILFKHYKHFKENDREVTFLLNCLLGVIIAISENQKSKKVFNNNIDDDFIKCIPDKLGFVNVKKIDTDLTNTDQKIKIKILHKNDLIGKDKSWFIRMLRNGIAHQNIEGINQEGEWVGVRLWNESHNFGKNFEIVFSIEELKKFTIFLAETFSIYKGPLSIENKPYETA